MGKILLLDCTLRDGGYVNDWQFGEKTIKGFGRKIAQTGVEIYEIGFIKGTEYNKDRAVFPDTQSINAMIAPKNPNLMYVAMLDLSSPVLPEVLGPRTADTVDGLRVIFKKSKIDEAYAYCAEIKALGYILFIQFVGTDAYTDKEFIEAIEKFNELEPYAVAIVDSFGLMKRKQFLRYVHLADNNLKKSIVLAYHAHNNLQQAFGNAEALVDLSLQRDVCVDACVFGMGRGAGNLNLELFAEYMNEYHGTNYRIEPMLEIMDEYLNDIYKETPWGYTLPFYVSAITGSHPNYASYLAQKDSLTVKSFNELLRSIPPAEKVKFSKATAERYYRDYQENFIDDKAAIAELTDKLANRNVVLLAPGKSLTLGAEKIKSVIAEKQAIVVAVNFTAGDFRPDYVFSSNMRRYSRIQGQTEAVCIITSNIKEAEHYDYRVNFASFSSDNPDIIDNSGLMALKLLLSVGVRRVYVAGMDGYTGGKETCYFDAELEYDFSKEADNRNALIRKEIDALKPRLEIQFLTASYYQN